MNADFAPFELAKRLKEKGFDIPFYFYYRTDDKSLRHANITNPLVYCDKIDDEVVIAPIISQVLKWLREEKKIFVLIDIRTDLTFFYEIWGIEIALHPIGCVPFQKYQSYEQAALAGIEYVLDNLI
jgi:hypothetical protein